eukprot:CCRYP_005784-RA/>CCRYP_005784-RA protein AED:0.28 eAED:0.28 QI:8878/1/1/1/0/0/2/362/88
MRFFFKVRIFNLDGVEDTFRQRLAPPFSLMIKVYSSDTSALISPFHMTENESLGNDGSDGRGDSKPHENETSLSSKVESQSYSRLHHR